MTPERRLDQAHARKLDGGALRLYMYQLAFLKGDTPQMDSQVGWGAGKPGDEDVLLSFQSDTEAYYGRLLKARDFSRRAADSAVRADSKETAALWQVNAALREAEFGTRAGPARRRSWRWRWLPGRDVKVLAALALGAGGRDRACEGDRRRTGEELPVEHGARSSIGCRPSRPPSNSNRAIPRSSGVSRGCRTLRTGHAAPTAIGNLYPAYLRGQADLLAHIGSAAATEFQKFLDHRGIASTSRTGRTGPSRSGPCLRHLRRHGESPHRVSGFLRPLERRRSRHPYPKRRQSGLRQAAVARFRSAQALPPHSATSTRSRSSFR